MTEFTCSRRLFLVGTATTFAGAVLAACGTTKGEASVAPTDVPVGSAVMVDAFIIAQPEPGVYKAYSNVCPHQGSKISKVDGNTVICPEHNSVFQISDGACIKGPARGAMAPAKMSKQGDQLHVSRN